MPLIRSWIFVVQQKELKRKKMSPLFWCWICAKWGELLLLLPLPLPLSPLVCSSNRLNSFENVLCLLLLFERLIHLCSGTLLLELLLLTHCRPWFPLSGTCYIPHTKKWHKKKLSLSFLMYNALMYSIQTNKHHWNGYSLRSQFIFIWIWVCVCVCKHKLLSMNANALLKCSHSCPVTIAQAHNFHWWRFYIIKCISCNN